MPIFFALNYLILNLNAIAKLKAQPAQLKT